MNRLLTTMTALWISAVPAVAQQAPVVVELFTSQGCSSCPPADAMLHDIANMDGVIALALHVDYWDYIGWEDEFADPRNAERQKAYAAAGGRRTIYTPQMVVNGTTDIVGAKPMKLFEAIEAHQNRPVEVELVVRRSGDELHISARALKNRLENIAVQMLRYQPSRESRITRGENAGRTISYANVTESWQVLGSWDSRDPLDMSASVQGEMPIVVLLQQGLAGPIVAAAELR